MSYNNVEPKKKENCVGKGSESLDKEEELPSLSIESNDTCEGEIGSKHKDEFDEEDEHEDEESMPSAEKNSFDDILKAINEGTDISKIHFPDISIDPNDPEKSFESMEKRNEIMDKILEKLKTTYEKKQQIELLQEALMKQFALPRNTAKAIQETAAAGDTDHHSVHVTNVHYSVELSHLADHFKDCGRIVRGTIPATRAGVKRGFAYIEFEDEAAAQSALKLSGSRLMDREIAVQPKRKNVPGFGRKPGRRIAKRGLGVLKAVRGGFRGGRGVAARGYRGRARRGYGVRGVGPRWL